MHFAYVDLPRWARSWKRGRRGIHLYYVLWQLAALRTARRLHAKHRFSLVWHVTLANAWLGSTAWLVGPPFVYGPIGGGVRPPLGLMSSLGARGVIFEAVRSTAQGLGRRLNPLARLAWRHASIILVQNRETWAWLPNGYRTKTKVLPNIVLERPMLPPSDPPPVGRLIFAGELLPLKGCALAVRCLCELPGWRLDIYGSGPDDGRLRRMANRLGVADRVTFHGLVAREDLLEIMARRGHVLLSLTLHEEGGWAVAEAIASGLPVVSLDQGGPPLLGAYGVRANTPRALAREVADAIKSGHVRKAPAPRFDVEAQLERLRKVLREFGLLQREDPESGLQQLHVPQSEGILTREGGLQ